MSDWSHGYDVSMGYTHGFYRETAPDWLDLSAKIAGLPSPRNAPDAAFRYLELGSGQGMGLCLMAAANPSGEFVGVDFHPEHIVNAERLAASAELTNVRFSGADFLALARQWPDDFGTFDYVVLHGIYSWVPPHVRAALIECLRHATHHGSLVYVSYNSQPGWLGTMPFQHISRRLQAATAEPGAEVMGRAVGLFDRLAENGAAALKLLPGLKPRLDHARTASANYLVQEYLNEGWKPMWHSEVQADFAGAGLAFAGTATAAETLMPGILPPPLAETITEYDDPVLRQDLQDIALNQSFRRDVYVRGERAGAGPDFGSIADVRLALIAPPAPGLPIEIKTAFGEIVLQPQAFTGIAEALAQGPMTIARIADLPGLRERGLGPAAQIILLLLHSAMLGVAAAVPGDPAAAHRLNRLILRERAAGAQYDYIASPMLGSAFGAKDLQLLMLDTWLQGGSDTDTIAQGASDRLDRLGRQLMSPGGALEGAERDRMLDEAAAGFLDDALPRWRGLGVAP